MLLFRDIPFLSLPMKALAGSAVLLCLTACSIRFNNAVGRFEETPDASVIVVNPCADFESGGTYASIGLGIESDPHILCNSDQIVSLAATSSAWELHYKLGADIDMNGVAVAGPIGNTTNYFEGVFDGDGHEISNYSDTSGNPRIGFFGVTRAAIIRNLTLSSAILSADATSGILVGQADYGSVVSNCHTSGTLTSSGVGEVGGLVGLLAQGSLVSSSSSSVDVNATNNNNANGAGGLVGYANGARIANSFATGNVTATGMAGGLVGDLSRSILVNSFSTGTVDSTGDFIGGLIGGMWDDRSRVDGCFSTSSVLGNTPGANVGSFLGIRSNNGPITNSYYRQGSCINNGGGGCSNYANAVNTVADPNYFYDAENNMPMSDWDLAKTWQSNLAATATPSHNLVAFDESAWGTCATGSNSSNTFAGGTGTYENPYLICTPTQLDNIGSSTEYWALARAYKLMANIDMAGHTHVNIPLGSGGGFSGDFDGNRKAISNLSLSSGGADLALFGRVLTANFKRIALVNVNVVSTAGNRIAGLVADWAKAGGLISDCYVTGSIQGSGNDVGALIGELSLGGYVMILRSYSTASITGSQYIGGLAGDFANKSVMKDSFSVGSVSAGGGPNTGALAGGTTNGPAIFDNTYYETGGTCVGCGNNHGTSATATDFYLKTNAPLSSWDFMTLWREVASDYPTF